MNFNGEGRGLISSRVWADTLKKTIFPKLLNNFLIGEKAWKARNRSEKVNLTIGHQGRNIKRPREYLKIKTIRLIQHL